MKEGILSQVADFKVAGLQIGAVGAGAVIGGVGDALAGLVSGFAPMAPSWAVKGGLAWAVLQWFPRIVGTAPAQLGALFLTYDAVQELFNIRASVRNIVRGITGKVVSASPPRFTGAAGPGVVGSSSYYGRALGGV